MYTVYCHIFPNGKRYVGITRSSLRKRWSNGNRYKTCPLVNRAIEKYGWDNIRHEVLGVAEKKAEAEQMEKSFIAEYNTTDPAFGYNILPGGDVASNPVTNEMRYKLGTGWRGKVRSEAEKEKIGAGVKKVFERPEKNGHLGMKASSLTKKRMSVGQKKAWKNSERKKKASSRLKERMADPSYKKQVVDNLSKFRREKGTWSMPEEGKKKLSVAMKDRWIGEKSPASKPVLQYTKDGVFIKRWANAGEVERAGIAQRSNVGKCCRGATHCHSAGGYIWKFETDG